MALSYSQLQTYTTCPRQFEYAYIKKIPRSISAGESFGGSVHNALKKWGEEELKEKREERKVGDQIQLFIDEEVDNSKLPLTIETLLEFWNQSFSPHGYESKDATEAAFKKGIIIMEHFYEWWGAQERTVLTVESGFTITADSVQLSGRFDRVEEGEDGVHVIDFKTSAVRSQQAVDDDLQLSIYALAIQQVFKKPCTKLTLLHLREDGVFAVSTTRSADQLQQATSRICLSGGRIDAADFEALPSLHACKHCPYNRICSFAETSL